MSAKQRAVPATRRLTQISMTRNSAGRNPTRFRPAPCLVHICPFTAYGTPSTILRMVPLPQEGGFRHRSGSLLRELSAGGRLREFPLSAIFLLKENRTALNPRAPHKQLSDLSLAQPAQANHVLPEALLHAAAQPVHDLAVACLLYTSPSPRDPLLSRMPSSA